MVSPGGDGPEQPRASDDRLRGARPIRLDYDEARTAEERGTYHQPRLLAQGEFFLEARPLARMKRLLRRKQR